jgi:hypothetical protein
VARVYARVIRVSRTPPTKPRVYGRPRRPGTLAGLLVAAATYLAFGLARSGPAGAQPDLDCAAPAEARALIGRLQLAEIEGAEDIQRAAMWEAFGRCPDGLAGDACRTAERRRFDIAWNQEKARIQAKYRALLSEFEVRCRGLLSRARPGRPAGQPPAAPGPD